MMKYRLPPKIPTGNVLAVDTETTGLNVRKGDRPYIVSLCNEDGETCVFVWPVDPITRCVTPCARDLRILRTCLENPDIAKVFHNSNFDRSMIEIGLEIPVRGPIQDTMVAMHCWRSYEKSYGLKELAKKYLGFDDDDENALHDATIAARRKAKALGWSIAEDVEPDYWLLKALNPKNRLCEVYADCDAQRTMALWIFVNARFEIEATWETYDQEMKVCTALGDIGQRGIRVDLERNWEELKKHKAQAAKNLINLRSIAKNRSFNPRSQVQVAELLFEKCGLEPKDFTANGNPRTDQGTLVQYKDHSVAAELLEYRTNTKAVTSFFKPFHLAAVRDPLVPGAYCLHPNLRQGLRTGRLACSRPNLQAIADDESSRSESPISARVPFGPRIDHVWFAADYAQLEARIFAAAADEPVLLEAFASGRDLHTETTNRAWGGKNNPRAIEAAMAVLETNSLNEAEVFLRKFNYDIVAAEKSVGKKNWRARGKTIFFSRIMGGGPQSIIDKLHCSVEEAKAFITAFDTAVPGIKHFLDSSSRAARRVGYATTLFAHRLHMFPEEVWKAGPYIVQGTAADLIKRRMLACLQHFRERKLKAHVVLQIHDELIFEVHKTQATGKLLRSIKRIMEDHEGNVGIDLPVEISLIQESWADKKKLDLAELEAGPVLKQLSTL